MTQLYIGLISGTSIDGIDTVLVDFSNKEPKLLAHHDQPINDELKAKLHLLCQSGESNKTYHSEIDLMGVVDHQLALECKTAVNALLQQVGITAQQINAIGSHGQTIRHLPPTSEQRGFTLQIGDANTLAISTGIDVVADFRRKDMALGGHGAPLVCGFHQAVFSHKAKDRVIVNIGGIGNITYLPALDEQNEQNVLGYDTGPGNTLLDHWAKRHIQQDFDHSGQWGRTGKLNSTLLNHLLDDEYFVQPAPKSTGRERFNMAWLDNKLANFKDADSLTPADTQHTLVHLSAKTIADSIKQHISANGREVFVCGGGAHNPLLLETLQLYLPQCKVDVTDKLGVQADYVEAMAFAWLAHAYCNKRAGNVPSVTGASKATILGALYQHI